MTTIQFSDVDIDGKVDMQPVELEAEVSVETAEPLDPRDTIPDKWKCLLEEEGADLAGIEWWEAPSFINTVGKQGFPNPMIIGIPIIIGLPLLFIFSFPLNLLVASIYTNQFITLAVLVPVFFIFGLIVILFFLLYITFLSETSFSVGGLGHYFYAATPRSIIIAYKAFPLPVLSSRLPTSVTTIPHQTKYFRGDLRWNGTGGLLLPSTNMTVEQKKQCLGGKGGFLYVKNMQILLSYLHSISSSGSSADAVPQKVSYGKIYARCNWVLSLVLMLCVFVMMIITMAVFPIGYWFSFMAFYGFIFILALAIAYYGLYWHKHVGVVHINSPPNPQHTPQPLIITLTQKFRHAIHR